MSPSTPKPANPSFVRRGLTLVEIILGLVVGALLVFAAFVSFQNVFNKTREQAELAALKSLAREAQALLAISGADRWDTQAGLDAVMGALEDWPPSQAMSVGVVADDSDLVVTEADVWPEMAELTFSRSPNTLLMVVALDDGACVVTAPPHSGTIQGGCVSNLTDIGETSPAEAVTNKQIPGINNTTVQPEQPTSTTTTTEPEPEPDPGFWAQTAAGAAHSCGITTAGDAYCWGSGTSGQLGNGNYTDQTAPAKVVGNHSFKEIAAGYNSHSCGVTTDGDAYCWGLGGNGELGNGNSSVQNTPVKVSGGHSFVSIAAAANHSCAVTTDGDAYCWGWNNHGQLGNGNTTNQLAPVKVVGNHSFVSIAGGYQHSCGITTSGDAYCWGYNGQGQLGNGNTTNQYTPVKVSGGHSFVSIAAGNHTCGVTTGGDAYCWGYDAFGGLGNGSGGHQNTPVKVSGNHSFVSVTAGNYHSCAVGADGDSYCWGWNAQGQLGIGNTAQQMTTPVKILGEHSFVSVTAGTTHTCGVTAAGDAYCWGSGANGRLGTGNLTDQTTPVLVVEP